MIPPRVQRFKHSGLIGELVNSSGGRLASSIASLLLHATMSKYRVMKHTELRMAIR
jgi:hypothetical protein